MVKACSYLGPASPIRNLMEMGLRRIFDVYRGGDMMRFKTCILTGLMALSFGACAEAQNDGADTAAAPVTPPPACASENHAAFDFWVGEWDVTPAGQDAPTAVNIITKVHGGCALFEDYKTQGGYSGMSLSFYDPRKDHWHQTWMGADGGPLFIEGEVNADGAMQLSDKGLVPDQAEGSWSEVVWTPNEDGSVRQHWRSTTDGGATWTTVFDGLYVKRGE